jgi:hypothetical protein
MNGRIAVDDLWKLLEIPPARRHQGLAEQLADAMKALGWTKTRLRIGGTRTYVYTRGPHPYRPIGVRGPIDDIPAWTFYNDEEGRAAEAARWAGNIERPF